MYLLDTNVCIYMMKNSYPKLTEKVFSHDPSQIFISSITVYELEYGAAKSNWVEKTRHKLQMFLTPFNILAFDSGDAVSAGNIRGHLEKNGNIIGPYDVQIAGQALFRGLILVTHNTGEFQRVPNLKIEDWTIPEDHDP